MKQLDINGTTLSVADEGEGHPVLLVHGFPLSHAMWSAQIKALTPAFRMIAPDLRGFGANDAVEGTLSMEQLADDLAAILDALEIDQPITYCGLSMGGYIACDFLRKHADRLQSLILCDTRAGADSEEGIRNRHKLAETVMTHGSEACSRIMLPNLFAENSDAALVKALRSIINVTAPSTIAAALMGMATRPDSTDMLPSIKVPTLIIVGEHDNISTASEMRSMSEAIPNCIFKEIADAGHMAPMEQPSDVNNAIVAFLQSSQC